MSSRTTRFVSDSERLELLREHIKVASEIVETFRVAYEDGIDIVPDAAVAQLDEALNRLRCAFQDTYASVDSDDDALKIDSVADPAKAREILANAVAKAKADGTYNPLDWTV